MLRLTIRNLAKDALDSLENLATRRGFFADTNKGKFIIRTASYEDELAYQVLKLNRRGILKWKQDGSGDRFLTSYKGLTIEVSSDLDGQSLIIELNKDEYVLSNSLLIRELEHDIWHAINHPYAHFSLRNDGGMRDYYDEQEKVAKKVMGILKSS
jgi:hypothetical protein